MTIEETDEDVSLQYAEELDLDELWSNYCSGAPYHRRSNERFLQELRELVANPGAIDGIVFCYSCGEPHWEDGLSTTGDGHAVCESCLYDFSHCVACDELYRDSSLNTTLSDTCVCDGCLRDSYSYCGHCSGYYHDEDSGDHDHSGACCVSPQLEFRIRNDGQDPLPNDTRVTVELPAGIISAEGLSEIQRYLQRHGHYDVSYDLHELGDQWQARTGNFAKRLSSLAYKRHQAKLTPEVLSRVGCIACDHSNAVDVQVEVTRDLNRDSSYFCNYGSCWWGGYSESRCALKTNGGFGLLSFNGSEPDGRVWVMPFKMENERLSPTFETLSPDAFVAFNGYGTLSGYAGARILAHMAGWTYRKIGFDCSPMYVNAGGYLIAPEHIAERYQGKGIDISVRQHSSLFRDENR